MNPEADKILALTMQRLAIEVAPHLPNAFAQSQVGLLGFMLTLAGNEYERGADLRAKENERIRRVFSDSAAQVEDAALRERLLSAAATRDESLKISALNKANWELRRLLIELHTSVESQSGDKARAIERNIWTLLRSIAAERMVKLAPG